MAKVISEKNLSGLGGVYDVSFGQASPERRARGDYSKTGVETVSPDSFDDYREKMERWERGLGSL